LILVFGSGAIGYAFVYQPISDKNQQAAKLDDEIQKKQTELKKAKADRLRLISAKKRSLPPDSALAHREYGEMLSRLLQHAKVPPGYRIHELTGDAAGTPLLAPKKPAYSKVIFELNFDKVDMWAIHDFLAAYYKLDLLQQITFLEIRPDSQSMVATKGKPSPGRKNLTVKIVTEAIILDGAETRQTLLSVPNAFAAVGGLFGYNALALTPEAARGLTPVQLTPVLATKPRDYTYIVQHDIFHGPLPLAPSIGMEKIADITSEMGEPIDPVKIRLTGDLGPTGKVALEAKAEGKILPPGSFKFDSAGKTLAITPAKGETGSGEITIVARTEEGKEAKVRFKVKITEPESDKDIDLAKLPDISDSIKLIIAVTRTDGTASAVIRDNFNPLTYEIEVSPSGRVKVTKFFFAGVNKKKDREYEDPALLIFSDDSSSTRRTFKIVGIDSEGLIVADLKPVKHVEKPRGGKADKIDQGRAEPLEMVAGAAAVVARPLEASKAPLYRWVNGLSLKALKEVPKDEAKKIIQRAAATGPIGAQGMAATSE
ncbi:MAG TPA: Ig domain-containing protein, partial [Urbifossiella sp.]